ncbi:hypothetical protein [Nocardia pseudobrasiliensis]|uniref:phosphoketolase family protein n=1 Tax=Nocardia pseudobrasiliensis TaxID=45979 RepID=UPI000A679B85|nr:hypothetical protein [Nocardia pseudobrasiliensis]
MKSEVRLDPGELRRPSPSGAAGWSNTQRNSTVGNGLLDYCPSTALCSGDGRLFPAPPSISDTERPIASRRSSPGQRKSLRHSACLSAFNKEGTVTTPFDVCVLNQIDRCGLAIGAIDQISLGCSRSAGAPAPSAREADASAR